MDSIVAQIIQALANLFGGSADDMMRKALQSATSTKVADLQLAAFRQSYGTLSALALLIAFVLTLGHLLKVLVKNRREETPIPALKGLGKVFAVALLLPGVVTLVVAFAQNFSKVYMNMFSSSKQELVCVSCSKNTSVGEAMNNLFSSFIGWLFRFIIWLETSILNNLLPLLILASLLAFCSIAWSDKLSKFGRWMLSFLITAVLLQPMIAVTLITGMYFIQNVMTDKSSQAWAALVIIVLASLEPIFLFGLANHEINAQVTNRQRIRGDVNATQRDKMQPKAWLGQTRDKLSNIRNGFPTGQWAGEYRSGNTSDISGMATGAPALVVNPQPLSSVPTFATPPANPRVYTGEDRAPVNVPPSATTFPQTKSTAVFAQPTASMPGMVRRVDDEQPQIQYASYDHNNTPRVDLRD